jgi:hypothetical protein
VQKKAPVPSAGHQGPASAFHCYIHMPCLQCGIPRMFVTVITVGSPPRARTQLLCFLTIYCKWRSTCAISGYKWQRAQRGPSLSQQRTGSNAGSTMSMAKRASNNQTSQTNGGASTFRLPGTMREPLWTVYSPLSCTHPQPRPPAQAVAWKVTRCVSAF